VAVVEAEAVVVAAVVEAEAVVVVAAVARL
jgi:hypothetical protein